MSTLQSLTFDRTAGSAWFMFTEAWLKLGCLNTDNFATDGRVVVYDQQVDHTEKVHNHDGSNSRTLHPDAVDRDTVDVNSTRILFGSYFNRMDSFFTLVGGEVDIPVTTAVGSLFWGSATLVDANLDQRVLGSYQNAYGVADIILIVPFVTEVSTSYAYYAPSVSKETAWKIHLTGDTSATVKVQFIAVMRTSY